MIEIIFGLVLLALVLDLCNEARRRRRQNDLHHITGPRQWWGQR